MKRLLIANRGEIARRVIRSAHRMGIETVAVYSDADSSALHVAEATTAFALGGNASADSYLRIDRLLEAARATGADAVHPGYGFLSENAGFAQSVLDAGLTWVGPPPAAIRALGNKASAKQLAQRLGVACLPGYQGEDQTDARFATEARRIGYPVMVKASAGGGGRGMRLVGSAEHLSAALQGARSEASSSFGSAELLIERALLDPRHVEVQVFADAHGHCIHLGERDCSVQRRHQKIIEESPSPAVDSALREAMGQCAVKLALAAGYVGAGTVEFLLEASPHPNPLPDGEGVRNNLSLPDGEGVRNNLPFPEGEGVRNNLPLPDREGVKNNLPLPLAGEGRGEGICEFFLMEMNTRLQVEHPVTELLTGLDLVEWQLRIARGEPLPLTQEQVRWQGHAIEVRLCAEDENFAPHSGLVRQFHAPEGVRFDHALRQGMAVPPYYDSMLGKIISHGLDRAQAIARLRAALAQTLVLGLPTNRGFLDACLAHPQFVAGEARIPFLANQAGALREQLQQQERRLLLPCVVALLYMDAPATGTGLPCPFARPAKVRWRDQLLALSVLELGPGLLRVESEGRRHDVLWTRQDAGLLRVTLDGLRHQVAAVRLDDQRWHLQCDGVELWLEDASFEPAIQAGGSRATDELRAPFNGKLIALPASAGLSLRRGEPLAVIESMKLEHALCAPRDLTVKTLSVQAGQQVATAQLLMTFEPA